MRLFGEPTVPLSFHDATVAAHRMDLAAVEQARAMQVTYFAEVTADLRDDYRALLDKYTSLKLAGAVEVPKPEPVRKISELAVPQPPDELKDLIGQMCGTDSRRRGMMLRALAADRANKVPDEKIRQLIEHGVESTGVPV